MLQNNHEAVFEQITCNDSEFILQVQSGGEGQILFVLMGQPAFVLIGFMLCRRSTILRVSFTDTDRVRLGIRVGLEEGLALQL